MIFFTTYVQHDDKFYSQINGTPMGCKISTFLCDIVLNRLDSLVNSEFPDILKYWRYVDDILSLIPIHRLPDILAFLNQFHPSLQFTYETAKDHCISFLDLKISTDHTGHISFNHYRKPSQTTRTIPFNSEQSLTIKINCIQNEVLRVFSHTSNPAHLQHEFRYLINKYLSNGYPLQIILKYVTIDWVQKKSLTKQTIGDPQHASPPLPPTRILVPYLPNIHQTLTNFQKSCNLQVVATKGSTIGNQTRKKSGPLTRSLTDKLSESNIVYQVPCGSCPSKYSGMTKQCAKSRFSSHKSELKHENQNNAFYQHFKKTGHTPDFSKFKILFKEKNYFARLNLETLSIYSLNNPINHIIPKNYPLQNWHRLLTENNLLHLFSPT
jgi:hypothetical protein